jgi:RND family efflux transporter MFP subunit
LPRVRVGQGVKLTVTAFPGSTFSGKIIFINSVVDPDTRTVKVRTEVPNPDGRLKPDMFANVEIVTDVKSTAVSVPQSAVLDDGGKKIVFVTDGKSYKQREVQLGIQSGDRIEIVDGLNAGDRVVVKGNYLLQQQAKPNSNLECGGLTPLWILFSRSLRIKTLTVLSKSGVKPPHSKARPIYDRQFHSLLLS